ncbi:bacteriohemerythrin [Paramagnetospirillum magneticum]|nr:hemerythrin family protein [Paramagnetospirillum magneticum]
MKAERLHWDFWSEELAIGHAAIDDDHKRILAGIERLAKAFQLGDGDAALSDGLALIVDYSRHHFEREERMLAAAGYAHLEHHRARHQSFCDYVAHASKADGGIDHGALLSYLVDWWVGHIASEDKLYRPALKGKEEAIAAAFGPHERGAA